MTDFHLFLFFIFCTKTFPSIKMCNIFKELKEIFFLDKSAKIVLKNRSKQWLTCRNNLPSFESKHYLRWYTLITQACKTIIFLFRGKKESASVFESDNIATTFLI